MLANSKIKYPSFRIDDILNNNFKSNQDNLQINDYDDQPINLSSFKFNKQQYDEFNKNLKSISSISSSSPTLSVASDNVALDNIGLDNITLDNGLSDSSNFQTTNQFSSKSPIIDQLIKYNLNDNQSNIKLTNNELFTKQTFNNQLYTKSIEDFYLKLNKNNFENYDQQIDDLNDNLNNTIRKLNQDYQTQLTKNTFNELPFYQQLQKEQFNNLSSQNLISQPLNQPNSSFYMQQFYIRMKMLMNAKPRKGGQIRFNHSQTNELETMFNMKKYLIPSERKQIAKKLSLSERQVKTWFQNRRAKQRRSSNYRA